MDLYVVILRIVHISFGAFWVGAAFAFGLFIEPVAKELGRDAGGFAVIKPTVERLGTMGASIPADQPPAPATMQQLERLGHRLHAAGRVNMSLLAIAVVAMASARYL